MATISEIESELEKVTREIRVLRSKLDEPGVRQLVRQLAERQIQLTSELEYLRNAQITDATIKRTNIDAWSVYDQTGRLFALGRTPEEAIAKAALFGVSEDILRNLRSSVPFTEPPSVSPASNPTPSSNDFVYDPVTGEMIPGNSSYAEELRQEQKSVAPSSDPAISRGPPRDDDRNLNPGWAYSDELGDYYVGGDYVDPNTQALSEIARQETPPGSVSEKARNPDPAPDWRVRVSLAKGADYLYNAKPPGILAPLYKTNGVIFPYMPNIGLTYTAKYDTTSPTHSNYDIHTYQGSSVGEFTIAGDFTAQDIDEANYLLAVIHFFRSATKMFYGQDTSPARGVPPPLVYLSGLGQYQFDNHPMVISGFTYTLPPDVHYINAYPSINASDPANFASTRLSDVGPGRLASAGLSPGAVAPRPVFISSSSKNREVTRVPTKISISITCKPIVTRAAVSNKFSLREYATGALLRGSNNPGGGMW